MIDEDKCKKLVAKMVEERLEYYEKRMDKLSMEYDDLPNQFVGRPEYDKSVNVGTSRNGQNSENID